MLESLQNQKPIEAAHVLLFLKHLKTGGYNRASILALRQAKIYLHRQSPAAGLWHGCRRGRRGRRGLLPWHPLLHRHPLLPRHPLSSTPAPSVFYTRTLPSTLLWKSYSSKRMSSTPAPFSTPSPSPLH